MSRSESRTSRYATKIAALLAKAQSTDSAAEREAFTEAAERLMVKWGVDDAMLDAAADSRAPRAKIEQRRYRVEGTSAALLAELVASRVVAGLGPMRGLISRGSPYWWAVGYTDDLARVEMYVPHIVRQARAGWKTHLRSHYANERDRVAFFDAFGWAVRGRLEKMFREEVPEPASGGGAALVIANRADAVDEFVNVPTARPRRAFGHTGATAGYEAGMAADLSAGALEGAGVTGS